MKLRNIFKHFYLITKHRYNVMLLCFKCGIIWQGLLHDLSKYSFSEFWESVKYYNGNSAPLSASRRMNGFSKAWLHHKGRNKHHIEYWFDGECTIQPLMPYKYAVECICDKIAAAKVYNKNNYTTTTPITHWSTHTPSYINEKTKQFISKVLTDLSIYGENFILNKKYLKETYQTICKNN